MRKLIFFLSSALLSLSVAQAQNVPTSATAPAAAVARKLPVAYGTTPTINYLRTFSPQVPISDSSLVNMSSLVEDVLTSTTYGDSYGRTVETITKQTSPAKKDNVSAGFYDEFGRASINYLPFVSSSSDGSFKTNPFFQDSVFHKTNFSNENINYTQTLFDGSPLNIPVKSMAQGNSWGGASVGISYNSRSNVVADSVVLWTIAINNENDVPVKSAFYSAGTLTVQEVTDERGIRSVQYTNDKGQVVLSKVQLSNTPGTAHAGWLCTYSVYDEMGQLRSVIPPKATELLNTPGNNWSLSATPQINTDLCYGYFYDSRGRCIMKRIPGKGKSYTAYDLYNRVVMTQDPRLAAAGQWAFVLYDAQSRPWRSGVITTATLKDSVIAQASRSMAYPALTGTYTITSETYFDNYDWVSGSGSGLSASLQTTNINGTNFISSYNTSPDYAQQIIAGSRTRGSITGTKKIILNTANYLYSLSLYDNQGRNIQSKQTNYSGGTDVATVQYSYAGRTLRSHLAHQKSGTNAQTHTLLTKYTYDHIGRIKTLTKNFDGLGDKAISQNTYSETGGVNNHVIGGGIETQVYTYNIRGWITGINGNHVNNTNPSAFFGETIAYDYGFTNPQLTGNKAGIKWRAAGDSNVRAYGYSYDNVNRLILAGYSQQNNVGSGSWTKDKMDFTASNMTYDANGNILSMSQRGLQVGSISLIDSLRYSYFANSNQLQKVADLSTGGGFMGDFKDSSSTGDDYTYDVNGNINRDNNRRMHGASNAPGAVFNILDKADSIVIADKATTYYYYDAGGAMLAKKVNTYRPTGTTVKNYQYLGGFVYLNDTLQYTLIEGGRIRYAKKRNSATGDTFYAYEYDYFISDHMGNVRSVVTEGRDTSFYQATMEPARQAVEDTTFANVYTPTNTITNKSDVPAFDSDGANQKVSVLNGNNNKVGAAIVLKVMAGDKIQLSTYAYYNTTQPPVSGVNLLSELLNVLAGGVVNNSPGKLNGGNTSAVSTALSPNVTNFLNNDRSYDNTKPKAYLNWIFFDNQFNFISGSSDAMQVDMAGSTGKKAMVPSLQTMPKNGYLYVYISNESNQNVYFDDITVRHTTGPLMQEQAYYPYGLEIQGLSDKALMKAATNYKYNAGSELEDEDGIGYYNTFYRKYDAQIGRFSGVDVLAENSYNINPFNFGGNNPAIYNDPYGDQFTSNGYNPQNGRSIKGPDNSFHAPWLAEIKWNDVGFFDWGNEGNASGNYSSIQGISSKYITSLFLGGNEFAKNKNGVYGFWIGGSFDPRDRGYKEAGGNKTIESEVVVGTNKKWIEFQNMGNNFGLSGGGFLDRIFKMGQFMQTGDKSTGETSDALFGKTTTNKLSKEFDVINLGAWGDRLWTSTYGGKVSGKAGNLVNLDVSTNNFGVDGYSISVFGGLVTVGFATDLTLSGGIGAFGYELHGNVGFSQLGFGYSHTQDNGQIGGSDHNVRAGLGSLAVALVIASDGILGPFIAPALK